MSRRSPQLALLAAMLCAPLAANAVPVSYDLTFQTSGQSLWDTGTSFTLDQTTFLGAAWTDKTTEINGIIGEGATVPNPARAVYDGALLACRGLGNSTPFIGAPAIRVGDDAARVEVAPRNPSGFREHYFLEHQEDSGCEPKQ